MLIFESGNGKLYEVKERTAEQISSGLSHYMSPYMSLDKIATLKYTGEQWIGYEGNIYAKFTGDGAIHIIQIAEKDDYINEINFD